MGISRATASRLVQELLAADWVEVVPAGRWRLIGPWMPMHVEEQVVRLLERARDRCPRVGEWLMMCLLNLLIRDLDYDDNARLSWLVSGEGSGRYEIDRLYNRLRVAFEFQGPQHFRRETSFHGTEQDFEEQVERDKIKAAICATEGIQLFYVTPADLSLQAMYERLSGVVPIVPPRMNRPLFRAVERMCRSYANFVARSEKRLLE